MNLIAERAVVVAQIETDDRGGDTYELIASVMALTSVRQPEVRALSCAAWGIPQNHSYLTVAKIRRALGDYFALSLAGR